MALSKNDLSAIKDIVETALKTIKADIKQMKGVISIVTTGNRNFPCLKVPKGVNPCS